MNTYIIFHANCNDGLAAAWVAHLRFGDTVKYIPAKYGMPFPEQIKSGDRAYILDFSWPRDVIERVLSKSIKLVILDHHATAKDDLQDLNCAYFDMEHSGAMLAWKHFFPDKAVPWSIKLVEDYDLWIKQYEDTDPFNYYLRTVSDNNDPANTAFNNAMLQAPIGVAAGKHYQNYINWQAQQSIKNILFTFTATLNGKAIKIPCVSSNKTISNETAHAFLQANPQYPICGTVWLTSPHALYVSLRCSDSTDINAGLIAKQFGGGGHPKAAGFRVSHVELLTDLEYRD